MARIHPDGGDPYEGARGEPAVPRTSGRRPAALTLSELNFSDTVWSSVLLFESLAFEQSKTLTSEIEKDVVLLGDEERLRRMTAILLDNAMKYSGEGGAVTLRLQKLQEKAVLTVHNTGDQKNPADQIPISFSGFTGWTAPATAQGGYGLSLSIAQSIVQAHHGKIHAQSDTQGTTFTVALPMCTQRTIKYKKKVTK